MDVFVGSVKISIVWRFPLRRKVSFLVLTSFIAALALVNHGCSKSSDDDRDESMSVDLNDPKIKERLGEDDGYSFAIMYGGDTHGSLETCG